jgi:hypothetical protein
MGETRKELRIKTENPCGKKIASKTKWKLPE